MNVYPLIYFIFTFVMPMLFLWSFIRAYKLSCNPDKIKPPAKAWRYWFLGAFSAILIIACNIWLKNVLAFLITILSISLFLLVRVFTALVKKSKREKSIRIKRYVILFFLLLLLCVPIYFVIAIVAGLSHSAAEIKLAPIKGILLVLIVVILPLAALLLYDYKRFSAPEKKKRAIIVSVVTGFMVLLSIVLVWLQIVGWPPIVSAARYGHYGLAKVLIGLGADVNSYDKYRHCTPLLYTIRNNDTKMAQLLAENGAKAGYSEWFFISLRNRPDIARMILDNGNDPNVRFSERNTSPLLLAIDYSQPELVRLLLEYDADACFAGEQKQNACDLVESKDIPIIKEILLDTRVKYPRRDTAQKNQLLFDMVSRGKATETIVLLNQGAAIEAKNKRDETPLLVALKHNRSPVARVLIEKGADIRVKEHLLQRTPLIIASGSGDFSLVSLLLEKGAPVDAVDIGNRTALVWAVESGHEQIRELLLQHGANPSYLKIFKQKMVEASKKAENYLGLLRGILQDTADPKTRELMSAIFVGNVIKVENLITKELIEKRIDRINGGTLLCWAAFCNQPEVAAQLIEKGADIEAGGDHHVTPLIEAAHRGFLDVVKVLMRGGADVNAATKKRWTALMWAGENGHVEVVRYLLQCGADKKPRNNKGKTALEIARAKGQQEVVKLLEGK